VYPAEPIFSIHNIGIASIPSFPRYCKLGGTPGVFSMRMKTKALLRAPTHPVSHLIFIHILTSHTKTGKTEHKRNTMIFQATNIAFSDLTR
jgi:hypothetical protein